jgi:hypothetical protein
MEKREAENSIKEIKRVLKETEDEVRLLGIHTVDYQLLWGILVLIGLGINHFLIMFHHYYWIPVEWLSIMVVGWIIGHFLGKKQFRQTGIMTFAGKIISITWFATTIGIVIIIGFGWLSKYFNPALTPSIIAIMLGNAYMITSFLLSSRLLVVVSPLWWIGSVITAIFPMYSFYIFMGLIIFTMILPGVIIKLTKKKEKQNG